MAFLRDFVKAKLFSADCKLNAKMVQLKNDALIIRTIGINWQILLKLNASCPC